MDQTDHCFHEVIDITNNYIPMSYLFILTFIILSGAAETGINTYYSHDIILIQGEPKLVVMTETGDIIRTFEVSTDYFTSEDSHADIVEHEQNRNEGMIRTRFISFQALSSDLTEDGVENVRYMTVLAEKDPDLNLVLTAPNDDSALDVLMNIRSLIKGFGVDGEKIKVVYKKYIGGEGNQFIKISLEPKGTS